MKITKLFTTAMLALALSVQATYANTYSIEPAELRAIESRLSLLSKAELEQRRQDLMVETQQLEVQLEESQSPAVKQSANRSHKKSIRDSQQAKLIEKTT